jgi:HSP20 family protein
MYELTPRSKRGGGELVRFKSEMDNLFNRFFDMDFPLLRSVFREGEWQPKVDIRESDNKIFVQAEIPGCDASDLSVELSGNFLIIKGEKKREKEEKTDDMYRVERSYGRFSRTIELPAEVESENAEAICKNGVLDLVLIKKKEAVTRKIEIKSL